MDAPTLGPNLESGLDETQSTIGEWDAEDASAVQADQINSFVNSNGPGITTYVVDSDGNLVQVAYNPDPQVGQFGGNSGVWVDYTAMTYDDDPGLYNTVLQQDEGGHMNTVTQTHEFIDLGAENLAQDNTPTWWDYANAAGSISVGALEVLAAEASDGLLAPVAGVDGAARITNGLGRIYTLATQGNAAAENLPTNLLGDVGAVIWGQGSKGQFYMQGTNDIMTMIIFPASAAGGGMGTGGIIGDAGELFSSVGAGNSKLALITGLQILDETGSMQDADDNWIKYKQAR